MNEPLVTDPSVTQPSEAPLAEAFLVEPPAQPAPVRTGLSGRPAPSTWSTIAATVLCGLIAAWTGWMMARGLAHAPLPRPAETAFAARTYAINRFGIGGANLHWFGDGPAALQVAGYQMLGDAIGWTGNAVAAARQAMIPVAVLTAVALGVAARRMQLSVPAAGAVVALFGLAPVAVLHRTADPMNLAVLWACLGLALAAAPGPRPNGRTGMPVGSLCCAVLAVVSSPLVLIALVPILIAKVWSGELGRLRVAWQVLITTAGAVCWTGLVALVTAGRLPLGGGSMSTTTPEPSPTNFALLMLGLIAGFAAVQIPWLRSLAVGLMGTAVAAMFLPTARTELTIIALPLVALLLPAVADVLVALAIRRHPPVPVMRRLVSTAAAGVLLLGTAAMASPPTAAHHPAPAPTTADSTAQARNWVLDNLPGRPRLAVDDSVWSALIEAGYPADQLFTAGQLGPSAGAWPHGWEDAQFVVGNDDALLSEADSSDLVRRARMHSVVIARFGSVDQVTVRRVIADPADRGQQTDAAVLARAAAGLLANPNLTLDQPAAAMLRQNQVDGRVISLLDTILEQHRVAIAEFPVVPGEDPSLARRLVVVTAVDGQPIRPGSSQVNDLEQWMLGQRPPLRPASTVDTRIGGRPALLVRYDASDLTALPSG